MANLTLTPTWVYPEEEAYEVITTESENFMKYNYLIGSTTLVRYRLSFIGLSDAQYASLLTQYSGVSGGHTSFSWTTVPSYIDGGDGLGVAMTGHWIDEPKLTPKSNSWDVELTFEKTI